MEQSDGSKSSKSTSRRRLTELRQFMDFVKESSYQGFDSVQKLLRRLEKLRQRDIFPPMIPSCNRIWRQCAFLPTTGAKAWSGPT